MDSERAETHLRRLAEAELRRATAAAGGFVPGGGQAFLRLVRVARALTTVGALDASTADSILVGFETALNVRYAGPRQVPIATRPPTAWRRIARMAQTSSRWYAGPSPQPKPPPYDDRAIPIGVMIPIRDDDEDVRGELYLLAFSQTASGARLSIRAWLRGGLGSHLGAPGLHALHRVSAADDRGTTYTMHYSGGGGIAELAGVLHFDPDPPPDVRWLDVTAPGAQPRRISLDPPVPPPAVTVTAHTRSPGEHLLYATATRILAASADLEARNRGVPTGARQRHLVNLTAGLGDVVDALLAAGALSPLSPLPGQLATICESLAIGDHGLTATLVTDELPAPWLSMLTFANRRKPQAATPSSGCAAVAVVLPELDGVTVSLLGLHSGLEEGTVVHVHASGVAPDPDPDANFLPVLWLRDDAGRWHAMQQTSWSTGHDGEATAQLQVIPPLPASSSIEVIAAGRSAEVRTTLPLRWR